MDKTIFAFLASRRNSADALMLSASIREFGGEFSRNPILVLLPHSPELLSGPIQDQFSELEVTLETFETSKEILGFPFGAKVMAAARAEELAQSRTKNLIWMDSDALLIQPPYQMLLQEGKLLAYRPVDHTLIGSAYTKPLDDFWKAIYEDCAAKEDNIFPMTASVDRNIIRPYVNAGMLVIDPENSLLQTWAENFGRLFEKEVYLPYYEKNALFKIFIHQAILAGTILSRLSQDDLQELPYKVNYPLHMHKNYPADVKPELMNELISARHDTFFNEEDWREIFPREEPLKSWLEEQLARRAINMEAEK